MHVPAQPTPRVGDSSQAPLTHLSPEELGRRIQKMDRDVLTKVANAAAESAGRSLALALEHRNRGNAKAAAQANAAAVRMAAIHNAAVSAVPEAQR